MTDAQPESTGDSDGRLPRTAGALLKAARLREGQHLATLAATIKVSPAKLEALEQDRYDQLPNATFTRALAQSVCRSLKIDPRPVLALLPHVEAPALEGSTGRLNTPFQDRPARADGAGLAWASKPMFWAGGLLLLAAVGVAMVPPDLAMRWASPVPADMPASAAVAAKPIIRAASTVQPEAISGAASLGTASATASASAAPLAPSAAVADRTAPTSAQVTALPASVALATSPPIAASMPSAAGPSASVGQGLLRLAASADSWIEVLDAQGQPVFSRILQRGEMASVNAPPPLRLRVGNAANTTLTFRGQPFDLAPYTRDNVARVELR